MNRLYVQSKQNDEKRDLSKLNRTDAKANCVFADFGDFADATHLSAEFREVARFAQRTFHHGLSSANENEF